MKEKERFSNGGIRWVEYEYMEYEYMVFDEDVDEKQG